MGKLCAWCEKRPCVKLAYNDIFCSEECEQAFSEMFYPATTEFKELQIARAQQKVDTFNSLLSDIKIDL